MESTSNGSVGVAVECDSLVSNERLECDSPVMWPDQNFCKFLLTCMVNSCHHIINIICVFLRLFLS